MILTSTPEAILHLYYNSIFTAKKDPFGRIYEEKKTRFGNNKNAFFAKRQTARHERQSSFTKLTKCFEYSH